MDRALWLLVVLRFKGWLRRFARSLRSVKGVLLTLVGMAFFIPWMAATFAQRPPGGPERLEMVRRVGPLFLLVYCLLSLFLSTGERAIYFSPAEVNFLFPAPFSRRQLLGYKISAILGLTMLSAVFMTIFLNSNSAWPVAAYAGLFLGLMFLQLFSIAVAMVSANVGELAVTWRRRLVLGLVIIVVASAVMQTGRGLLELPAAQILSRAENSPVLQAVLMPFRWFIMVYTAERLWPDLVKWAAVAISIDLGLVVFILMLDAQYLEAAASNSARVYALLEQRRRGSGAMTLRPSGRVRFSVPTLPWWGGAGPIAWRQITSAVRNSGRLLLVLIILVGMGASLIVGMSQARQRPEVLNISAGSTFLIAFYLTYLLPFDFRADIDRMAELKSLPVSPIRMAIGQLVTPVAFITLLQWFVLLGIAAASGGMPLLVWAALCAAVPFNLLLLEIENVMFLWFPTRLIATTPGDIQTMGRAILLMLAKVVCLGFVAGSASLVGLLVYLVSGHNEIATFLAGLLVLTAEVLGLLPLVAFAYRHFDVARDVPA